MTIFDAITCLRSQLHAIEAREHAIWTAQTPLIASIRADIKAAFGANSLEQFTHLMLAAPGNLYLQIEHTCSPVTRFAVAVIELRQEGDKVVAWKRGPQGPVYAGEVDQNTFHDTFIVYSDGKPKPQKWIARDRTALPLNGAIASHGLGRRLIALANSLLDNDDRMNKLDMFNREMFKLHMERDAIRFSAHEQPVLEYGPELLAVLNDENAELVKLIQTMDFTYDYADRPSRASGDQEMAIRIGLNKLPLDDATALFVTHAGTFWSYAMSYLSGHPGRVRTTHIAA